MSFERALHGENVHFIATQDAVPLIIEGLNFGRSGDKSAESYNGLIKLPAFVKETLKNSHEPLFFVQDWKTSLTADTQSPTLLSEGLLETCMSNRPHIPAKEIRGNSDVFTNFMRRLVQVPHSEIKEKLDAEKEAKRTPKPASRVPAVSSKVR